MCFLKDMVLQKQPHMRLFLQYTLFGQNKGSRIPINYTFNKENYAKLKSSGFRLEF